MKLIKDRIVRTTSILPVVVSDKTGLINYLV
jgi:hypothetical protein